MPFVHLANGDVIHHTQKELDDIYGDDVPNAYRKDGKESGIIGIYADDVELPKDEREDEK